MSFAHAPREPCIWTRKSDPVTTVFIPYVLFEVPSNIVLKKFKRPSMYLGILVVSWGTIMTCTGLVQNFGSLMATRVLLGIFE